MRIPGRGQGRWVAAVDSAGLHPYSRGANFVINLNLNTNMPLTAGTKAPEFTLKSKQAAGLVDVKLSDNLGKRNTVLLFFPLAFTGVCTQEMCDITAGLGAYQGLDAEVIGISVDSPFSQEAWAQKEKIGVRLASDLNKKTAADYGVLLPDLIGLGAVSARAAFVIDKQGVIRYAEQTPTVKDLPNFEAVKRALEGLK
jgi:peroxiredoxin